MLFSATVPKWVKKLVKQYLNSEFASYHWLQAVVDTAEVAWPGPLLRLVSALLARAPTPAPCPPTHPPTRSPASPVDIDLVGSAPAFSASLLLLTCLLSASPFHNVQPPWTLTWWARASRARWPTPSPRSPCRYAFDILCCWIS